MHELQAGFQVDRFKQTLGAGVAADKDSVACPQGIARGAKRHSEPPNEANQRE